MAALDGLARLQLGARHPGSPSSPVVAFFIPGLDDLHFFAWGTTRGSIAVSCAQAREPPPPGGSSNAAASQPAPLHSALVLDLTHPPPNAQPLEEAVLHLSYGGGPQLLLAAATEQWLVVCSLERFAASAFSSQTGSGLLGAGGDPPLGVLGGAVGGESEEDEDPALGSQTGPQQGQGGEAGPLQLYCQLAAVQCSGGPILSISWTQQLDGILVSQADGTLTMWHLAPEHRQYASPMAPAPARPVAAPGAGPSGSSLPLQQQQGEGPHPASARSAGGDAPPPAVPAAAPAPATGAVLLPAWRAAASAPQDLLSAGASVAHPCASSSSERQDKGANIWWPPPQQAQQEQVQQQEQQGSSIDIAAAPLARCERLKHPCALTGLEWSPGVLRKDPHSLSGLGPSSQAGLGPTAEGAEAAAHWEGHPALMTVGSDGVIRLWVEMVVMVHPAPPPPAGAARSASAAKQGEGAQLLPGPGGPHVESYFCMALVVEPPQSLHSSGGRQQTAAAAPAPVTSAWGRSPGCLLGRAPIHAAARAAAPVLWLLSVVAGASGSSCMLRVHAVRGLSPVVMTSYLGAMSSSGGGGTPRPQALLWGQCAWEGGRSSPAFASEQRQQQNGGGSYVGNSIAARGGAHAEQKVQQQQGRLSCWVTAEDEFPTLHVVSSEAHRGDPQLRVQYCSLKTVEEEESDGSPGSVHRRLAMASSWHVEHATHSQDISSLLACPSAPLLASLDAGGTALFWHSTPGGELQALGPLLSPAGPVRALGWASACAAVPGTSALLAVDTPSRLLFLSMRRQQQGAASHGQHAQQHSVGQQWEVSAAGSCDLPGGLHTVQALHLLPCGDADSSNSNGGSGSSGLGQLQLRVAAVCCGPGVSSLHLQGFVVRQLAAEVQVVPATPLGRPQLPLFPPLHAFPATVTCSAAVAEGEGPRDGNVVLAAGLANASLVLLRLAEPAGGEAGSAEVAVLAELPLVDVPAALAVAPGAAFVAAITAGDQDRLDVWRRVPASHQGGSGPQQRYALEACLPLPDTPTALTWLGGLAAPALAVGCAGEGVLLFAKGARGTGPTIEGQAGWARLAALPCNAVPGGVSHLALAVGGVVVGAGGGGELFSLHGAVVGPGEGGASGRTCSLARLVLDRAGPLPQYHPATLATLLLVGRARGAAAVLRALLAWVQALRQHRGEAAAAAAVAVREREQEGEGEGWEGTAVAIGEGRRSRQLEAGRAGPEPEFQSVPLAELLESIGDAQQLAAVAAAWSAAAPAAKSGSSGGGANGRVDGSAATSPAAPPRSAVESAQLDMGAFGRGNFGADPTPQPVPSALESGQLDMAAFGMGGFGAPEPAPAAAQQPAASALETGQLDMGAFGMGGFGAPEPAPAAAQQAAASALETGQLDMGAFGMGGFGAPEPAPAAAQQPAASVLESGQLDMAALGMDGFAATNQPQPAPPPPAASLLESGQLDMAAFGMAGVDSPAPQPAPQPVASAVESGQLDMSAFGMGNFASTSMPTQTSPAAPSAPSVVTSVPVPAARAAPAPQHPPASVPHALPPSPGQQLAPAERLRPLPAEVAQQLLEELAIWQQGPAQQGAGSPAEEASTYSFYASSSVQRQPSTQASTSAAPSQATPLPGLTAHDSAALVTLVGALARPPASSAGAGTLQAAAGPVDTCGAHFLSSLTLALASQQWQQQGGAEQRQGGPGYSAPAPQRGSSNASLGGSSSFAAASSNAGLGASSASGLFARHRSIKNAAGVEYTLPPASSASLAGLGSQEGASRAGPTPLAQAWGLTPGLDATAVLWAALSGTQLSLLGHAVEQAQRAQQQQQVARSQQEGAEPSFLAVTKQADHSQPLAWELLRGLGAGFWLSDPAQVHEVAESLAKAQFAAGRNPDECALLYCALGKKAVLQGLYRTTQNRKLAEFLARDFSKAAHRQAACKNAFVLLGQHRHGLAGAFFILGGAPEDAVGVCAHEMKDPQLALFLCRVIWGPGSVAERRVLERDVLLLVQEWQQQLGAGTGASALAAQAQGPRGKSRAQGGAGRSAAGLRAGAGACSSDAPTGAGNAAVLAASSAEALCKWMLGDVVGAALAVLGAGRDSLQGAMTPGEAAQLLPLLLMLLPSAAQAIAQRMPAEQLRALAVARCLAAADALQVHGVHALALCPLLAALRVESAGPGSESEGSDARAQLQEVCTLCLLRTALPSGAQQQGWRSVAQRELAELQQMGMEVDADAVLGMLRSMAHQLSMPPASPQHIPAFLLPHHGQGRSLESRRSSGSAYSVHSAHPVASAGSGRGQGAGQVAARQCDGKEEGGEVLLLGEGHLVFRVDGDRGEAVACSPFLSPEGGGRPLVLATRRHGLVGGEACLLPSEAWAGQEEAVSPSPSDSSRSSAQRGSMFSRLIDQLFDQTRFDKFDSDWIASEGEVSTTMAGAMMAAAGGGILYGGGMGVAASSTVTSTLCSHPSRSLFLSGCATGRVHLWQFGNRQALASYSPVPQSDLGEARGSSLLSFSNRLRGSPATSRLANWGRCAALRFSANGERFAAVGEGGVVATWRLDSPLGSARPTDSDGSACADWWQMGLSRGARTLEFVGGSSSVVAVGGRCSVGEGGNIAVWDTLAPPSSSAVGRLGQHQMPVAALCMLPGGWLLASGDEAGALCLSDVRMMGAGKGARVLWSVRAVHGTVASIAWATGPGGLASGRAPTGRLPGWLVTGGQDGAVRCWQAADGQLLQAAEPWRQRSERSGGGAAVAVTGLAVCAEGVVVSSADGAVRLLPFNMVD